MSLSNFFKYTDGPPPRVYIFSSNSQATIIESPNEVTQLALLTSGKTLNSVSFLSTYSNIGVYDRNGPMFFIGRQSLASNSDPRIETSGSLHTKLGYFVQNRVVVNQYGELFGSNVFVDGYTATQNIVMSDYNIQVAGPQILQLSAPAGFGREFAFQYTGNPTTALKIGEANVIAPRFTVGTPNNNTEVFTVNGRARIDRGLYVSRPQGLNTLLLSDPAAPNDTVGPRMVVFREYIEGTSSTYAGIGFDGGLVYTTASTDQNHKFLVTRDRPREVMRIGSDTLGNPRIGIGFSADTEPITNLHLIGNARFEGDLFVTGRFEGPENLATLDESGRIRVTDLPDRIPLLDSNNKIDNQYLPVANCNLNLYRSSLNVGIGTNVPKQKLHLAGNMYIESGRLGVGIDTPMYPIHVHENSSTNALYFSYSAAGGDHMYFENAASNDTPCYIVTHDGRVGIKTRPDVGYDLHVSGEIKAGGLTIPTISLDVLVASNVLSGGLTTNTTLNGITGSTKLEGYTVSSDTLGVSELAAYPDAQNGYVYLTSRMWMTKQAPQVSIATPNENTVPVPLTKGEVFNALSNIQGYTIQTGQFAIFKISLLGTELSSAIPTSVLYDSVTETTGYQSDQFWPYIFSGMRELITGQISLETTTNNLTSVTDSLTSSVSALQNENQTLRTQLDSSSNLIVQLETRITTLEQQMASVFVSLSNLTIAVGSNTTGGGSNP